MITREAKTNKVVRFYQTGGLEVLKTEEVPIGEPGAGEVRLRIQAVALNRGDAIFREGNYLQSPEFPARLGVDAAAIVEAVGPELQELPDVSHQPAFHRDQGPNRKPIKVGDNVLTLAGFNISQHGVLGKTTILPASFVVPYPNQLTPVEGAALLTPFLTSWGALIDYGQMSQGDYVLLTAASSSVGVAALQIIRATGAIAIATTRNPAKKQALLDAGADYVIVTSEEDVVSRVKEITSGKGVRLAFDSVAGSGLEAITNVAAQGGQIFIYGALAKEPTITPLWTLMAKELNIRGYSNYEVYSNPERFERGINYLYDGVRNEILKPVIAKEFTFEQVVSALGYMESNEQMGKIVVTF